MDTKLTITAEARGTSQTADELQKLADAQARLKETGDQLAQANQTGTPDEIAKLQDQQREYQKAVDEATSSTKGQAEETEYLAGEMAGLNVRAQDFVGILNQIDPTLGAVAATMSRAGRIGGEFGVGLSTIGLAVAGVYAIGKAWAYAAEQIEKATEATKQHQEATNKFLQTQGELQATIERVSDTRREGGLTADQSRAARATAKSLQEKWGTGLDEGSINEAVGLLSGTGATEEDIEDAAFLTQMGQLKLDPALRGKNRLRQLQAARRRKQSELAGIKGRERVQAVEDFGRFGEARKQLLGGGGPQLEEMVREALGPGTVDEEIQDAMKSLGAFPTLGELNEFEKGPKRLAIQSDVRTQLNEEQRGTARRVLRYMEQQGHSLENRVRENVPGKPEAGSTRSDAGDPNIQRLNAEVTRMADAAEKIANTPPQTIHNEANSKYIVPGAAAQRWARMNGERRARDVEE